MRPLVKQVLVRVALFITCGLLGGLLFWAIEYQGDQAAVKAALLQSLNKTMSIKYNMTAEEFDNFTKMSFEALRPLKPQMNIENAIELSFTAITTIGYGRVTPVTQLGQMVCILYSLVGIPITLLALKSVGELIKEGLIKLIRKFETRLLKRAEAIDCGKKCALTSFLLTITMICLGAGFTMLSENWTFLGGTYFWFVSFATIGFGDYVLTETAEYGRNAAGDAERAWVEIVISALYTMWYILGLCMVSGLLMALQDMFVKVRCPQRCPCFHRRVYKIDRTAHEKRGDGNLVSLGMVNP